jgi:hypothetical protein
MRYLILLGLPLVASILTVAAGVGSQNGVYWLINAPVILISVLIFFAMKKVPSDK